MTVPREEVAGQMDDQGLSNVCSAEIEKGVVCCWVESLVEFGRFCGETVDGISVCYALGVGQITPGGNGTSQ